MFGIDSAIAADGSTVFWTGSVLASGYQGERTIALNAKDGSMLWSKTFSGGPWLPGSWLAMGEGLVFIGYNTCVDSCGKVGYLVEARAADNGALKWGPKLVDKSTDWIQGALLSDGNGTLYAITGSHLKAHASSTGTLRWSHADPGRLLAIDPEHLTVFGAGKTIAAYETSQAPSTSPVAPNPTQPALFFAPGDSIVSGHGLRPYEGIPGTIQDTCKRSFDSFAYQLSDILAEQGFTDYWYGRDPNHAACTGYTTDQIAWTNFAVPYVIRTIKNTGRDGYVVIDGGINDFDFESGATGNHMYCDSKDDFQAWVDGVLGGISYTMARKNDATNFGESTLGRLLDAGNTRIVVTGYYNSIEQNRLHPLLAWWDANALCNAYDPPRGVERSVVLNRVAWVLDRLNRELQSEVGFANQQRLGLGTDRVRFVQPADAFKGNVQCNLGGPDSFVQHMAAPWNNSWYLDGGDCVHPSIQGSKVIADIALAGFTETFDQCPPGVSDGPVVTCGKYHVQGTP